ncbi:MAG TPA: 5-methyltetrahydropteroyltriglutamate--homocysteine methyltransferase [Chloroflexota bacterium]|nr:5-methyltetrahydropteroyltriglutamate--homocysteine methyltransferase [Chloroflexota bacterium]
MQLPPVATTTVGSFPRPSWLADIDALDWTFRLEGAPLREAQDDATIVTLHDQEQAGLDLLTDGEQRRPTFINHFLGSLDGIDLADRRAKVIRRRTERQVPRVTGPVRRRVSATADDLRFARAHTARPLKLAVPGPMTVVDSTYDEVYGDEVRLAMDVAAALNAELRDLQAAGCDVVQIDEPAMTRYHEKVAAYGAEALDRCLEGITIPSIVHLCYGYPNAGGQQHQYEYPALLAMLMETRIGGFSVEFARSGYDPALLRGCGDRLVMYGCVDPGEAPPEPVEAVVARVRAALPYVDPARLLLAPDCGLMTISRELARAKAALLVESARIVRAGL